MKRLGNFLTYKGWIEDSCPGSLILEPSMLSQHTCFQSLEEKSCLGARSKEGGEFLFVVGLYCASCFPDDQPVSDW